MDCLDGSLHDEEPGQEVDEDSPHPRRHRVGLGGDTALQTLGLNMLGQLVGNTKLMTKHFKIHSKSKVAGKYGSKRKNQAKKKVPMPTLAT